MSGSAPRVRGTVAGLVGLHRALRFSPACAGNGPSARWRRSGIAVQPRVCGERLICLASLRISAGSAPRVRGTDASITVAGVHTRFSPACAGNGTRRRCRRPRFSVQPRVCGERGRHIERRGRRGGSAPRVRGTAPTIGLALCQSRFSPACAGNGMDFPLTTRVCAVQPRVCGERSASVLAVCDENGSAPRVRGTVQIDAVIGLVDRFSPACAGNGGRADLWWAVALVQPRVCGERFQSSQARPQTGGSAPRVRGTDLAALMVVSGARFSPACAGNGSSTG